MKLYLAFALLLTSIKVNACYCEAPYIQTKEDVDRYDFVALVKITALAPRDSATQYFKSGYVGLEIKELFKGEFANAAFNQSYTGDCLLNLNVGEQWLVFGRVYKGKLVIGSCDNTRRYRDFAGMRDWYSGDNGIPELLDQLRQFYGHPLVSNAVPKAFYPNGNLEFEQVFKNGKLDGKRVVYFPDGKVYMTEQFKNGERIGQKNVYFPDEQIMTHEEYVKGLVKCTILYHDTAEIVWYLNFQTKGDPLFGDKTRTPLQILQRLDSLRRAPTWGKQIRSIYVYSDDGRSYTRKFYALDGKLDAETYLDWNKKISEHKMYYPNGKLKSDRIMDQINNKELETDYHEDGTKHDYVNKCTSCKFYFNPDKPAATPDKVYVQ